jgi:Ca-activated chloride channel family protein
VAVVLVVAPLVGVAARAAGLLGGSQQVPVFRAGVEVVNFTITVTDRDGRLAAGLGPDDFDVYEDGRKQIIRYFAAGDVADERRGPDLHLGVLLDVSESMGDDVRFTRTAAIKFLNTLTDAVDVTVVDFDTEVRAARYSQAEFPRLVERIRQQKTSGMTALYDAVGVYLDGAAGQTGRKVMLLYTDGGDTTSSMRLSELMDLLKASDVTVYAIGELDHQSGSSRERARSLLQSIAETTGGRAFFPSSVKDLDAMYAKVVAEIRAQYLLGYLSTNTATDGAWRKVEIEPVGKGRKNLRVRARKGYFGPYVKPAK